jgi:hypothetical protein
MNDKAASVEGVSGPLAINCPICGGSGSLDSGGFTPWDEAIFVKCGDCDGVGKVEIVNGRWRKVAQPALAANAAEYEWPEAKVSFDRLAELYNDSPIDGTVHLVCIELQQYRALKSREK